MILDLPSHVLLRLEEKAREQGVPPAQYAVSALTEILERANPNDYQASGFADEKDTPLSDEEAAEGLPGILRGLADQAAGRTRPATDVFRDLEIKYDLVSPK